MIDCHLSCFLHQAVVYVGLRHPKRRLHPQAENTSHAFHNLYKLVENYGWIHKWSRFVFFLSHCHSQALKGYLSPKVWLVVLISEETQNVPVALEVLYQFCTFQVLIVPDFGATLAGFVL